MEITIEKKFDDEAVWTEVNVPEHLNYVAIRIKPLTGKRLISKLISLGWTVGAVIQKSYQVLYRTDNHHEIVWKYEVEKYSDVSDFGICDKSNHLKVYVSGKLCGECPAAKAFGFKEKIEKILALSEQEAKREALRLVYHVDHIDMTTY